uniref:CCHC-type domain-containing protein n=1 Tax=Fagus sylvatica TaxID=28930 RepID=A0A2N9IDV6_FAGSY
MSHKSDSSPKGKADNSSFVLQAMQQQFEQLNFVLGEVRDRMDHQEAAIRNLQGGRDRRRRERRVENEYENEGDGEDEEDLASEVGSGRHRRVRRERGHEWNPGGRDGVDRSLGSIKMKIPSFQGRTDPEVYLEWEKKIDLVFDCHNYSEEKKVKLAVIEFTDYAIIWWDQLVTNRRRNNERPVETWGELKAIMRRRFVPSHFYRDLYQKLQNLTQGSRSVEDYHKEMEVAMIRANVHMAMKVERQLKRKGTARYTSVSNTTWKSKWDKNDPAEAKRKTEPPMRKDEGTSNKPKVESQPSRNRDIKCFKCLGSGHIASQCPNRRVMIMRDNGEVMTESEDDSDGMPELVDASDDDGVVYPVTGESLVARRALNTHIKVDDAEQQRENIFHTRCHVNNKEYEDVFPNDVPSGLPPIRGIEYQIDFVSGATIPNRPAYRSNPGGDKGTSKANIDGNQGGPSLKDPLQVLDGPITRSRAKKIKEAMQGLVQSTWDEASKSPTIKDHQETVIRNLQGGRDRRRREPRVENEYENEGDGEDEEDLASEVGSGRHRRVRRERGHEWNPGVTNRRRNNERPVETWGELKALMRRRFVPSHFYRDLYQRLQNLTQGSRSVEDYHKEMEVAMIRANVEEDREATMARFLSGLNRDIANVIELQHYVEIEDMVHMAMKVERQLKRKGTARRVMIMRDNGEVMTESEDDSDGMPELVDASDDDGVVYPVTGESLVARRALNTHIKVDDAEQQRENIFHTRCHVNNKASVRYVITPFLPTGFSRVSVRKTGQPEPNQHDLTTLRHIKYSQEEGPGHISRAHLGGSVCAKILSDPLQLGPRAKTLRQEVHFSYHMQLSDRQEFLRSSRNLSQKMTPWHEEHSDGLCSQDHILRTQARLCARPSLPDSQQVDLRARAHWKEDTFHARQGTLGSPRIYRGQPESRSENCPQTDQKHPGGLCSRGHISQVQARISANPEPCKSRQRKLSDGTKNVKIRHRELGQICARTGTRFEKKRAGSKTHFFSRTAAFARRVFPARNKLIREPGCVGKIMTPATTWNSRFADSIPPFDRNLHRKSAQKQLRHPDFREP